MSQAESADAVEHEDEVIDQADEGEDKQSEVSEEAGEESREPKEEASEAESDDEVTVSIGEESPPSEEDEHARAPEWVRDLRTRYRDLQRENRELKAAQQQAQPAKPELGPKPTLEDADFDADVFAERLEQWHERKRSVEAEAEAKRKAEEQQQAAWQAKQEAYAKAKGELKLRDFDDAEASVKDVFSVTQQGLMLHGADNPALLVYALGRNPKKAAELAAVTDPVLFAFKVAKLETQLKVTPRKAVPLPEKTVSGSANGAITRNARLDELRRKAEQTGDYTAYFAAKRAQGQ